MSRQIWRVLHVIDEDNLVIWDGVTKEKWNAPSGTMELHVPGHEAEAGDHVTIRITIKKDNP